MEKKIPELLRKAIALMLCAAMVLPFVPLTAQAAEPAENVTVITDADTLSPEQVLSAEPVTWSVDSQNYYTSGGVVVLHGCWAQDIADASSGFNDGAAESWQTFINDEEYKNYTAYIMEFLGSGITTGYEFFVDAVIDGAVKSDEEIYQIRSHTDNGFVLFVPTAQITDANRLSRGDLVGTNWNVLESANDAGHTGPMGILSAIDNPVSGVSVVEEADVAGLNANVKLFNYDENMNVDNGFNFWAGFWGYGGDVETVDGSGEESTGDTHRYPNVMSTLDENGYPQLVVDEQTGESLSLGYLFDGSSERQDGTSVMVADMTGGGGLFQKDEDGYYYYDSLLDAAYYDPEQGSFVLYDNLAVRPWYGAGAGGDTEYNSSTVAWEPVAPGGFLEAYGNFLPFNEINAGNITTDVSYAVFADDGTYAFNITNPTDHQTVYPAGTLEYAGLKSYAAAKLLTGTKGLSETVYNAIADHAKSSIGETVTTARLEEKPDMWFGMTVDFEFFMPEGGQVEGQDMTFDFHGDDDVFVYLGVWDEEKGDYDYSLVLDIGGVHEARSGVINFATGAVTDAPAQEDLTVDPTRTTTLKEIFGLEGDTFDDYTKLSLKFFYLERGGNISYCRLRFNIPTLPDNSLTVTKELTDSTGSAIESSGSYLFRVVQAENTDTSYFLNGTRYTILENGAAVGYGTLQSDGVFTLKAGQSAQFENVLANSNGGDSYIVQELLPSAIAGQYRAISYSIGGGAEVGTTGSTSQEQILHTTGTLSAEQTQTALFRNTVDEEKLGTIKITKTLTEKAQDTLSAQTFRMELTLAGELLPVGTAYTVDGENRTVTEAGVIELMADQTAQITGVLSGAEYVIRERVITGGYAPAFTGTVTGESEATITLTEESAYGAMPLAGTVEVTVTNDLAETDLVVDKTVEAADDPNEFKLTLEAFATGTTTSVVSTKPADIVLVLDQSASMYTPAGYSADRLYADKDRNSAAIPASAKVDLVSLVNSGDTQVLENAKHTGYYIAVANGYTYDGRIVEDEYLYVVKYAEYAEGQWGWFYVPVDMTARAVEVDTANTTKNSTDALFTSEPTYDSDWNPIYYKSDGTPTATLRDNESLTCCWDYALMSNFTYYKTQYAELYDSIKAFVARLHETGVDHNIAIVGFSSPFFDAMAHYEGTGVYIDGEYYLYDSAYMYKGKYVNGTLVRDDDNGTVILDPEASYAGDSFSPVAADQEYLATLKHLNGTYTNAFNSVQTELDVINKSIEAIQTNYLQTCPAIGIRIARNIFYGDDISLMDTGTKTLADTGRDRIIVLFTDGVPTVSLDCNYDHAQAKYTDVKKHYEHWDIRAGAASAINEATRAKAEGVTIYTIGTGAAENLTFGSSTLVGDYDLPFLDVVSSNYTGSSASFVVTYATDSNGDAVTEWAPKSTTYTVRKGTATADGDYAAFTSEDTGLDIAFDNILSSVTAPSVDLDETAVLKEVLSDYFVLTENDELDIKVYTQAYDPATGGWKEKVELKTAQVKLSSSDGSLMKDGSARFDTIEVSGFDYHEQFVSSEARTNPDDETDTDYYGSKLVVEVSIRRRDGFWGGNNVPTNEDTTAIYHDGLVIEKFPIPEANVPLSLEVKAEDKTIYYGGDVSAEELLDSITADGYDVTVSYDETEQTYVFTPAESWMDDYAQIGWTEDSVTTRSDVDNLAADDYTFSVEMHRISDGKNNESGDPGNIAGTPVPATGLTDSDTGHVYILVPQVTFKDSTAELNADAGSYDYTANDYVTTQWVHMETTVPADAPEVSGTAPTLTLTYTPERGSFTEDTRVDVDITSSDPDGDIAAVTIYKWESCVEDLHRKPVHGTIATHSASAEGQHEFWIHVADDADPDSDLILDKTVSEGDSPNQFVLTLDAYSLASIEDIAKPADIVLVLDHSGSMHTPIGATKVLKSQDDGYVTDLPNQLTKDALDTTLGQQFGYYIAQSKASASWFVLQYHGDTGLWYGYLVRSTEAIVNTQYSGIEDAEAQGGYTEHEKILTWTYDTLDANLVYYKTQYGMLYDEVNNFADGLRDSGMDHRVAIVGFAGSETGGSGVYVYSGTDTFKKYTALHHANTTQARRDELYQLAMKSVQDAAEFAELSSAIDAINTNHSYTCPAVGIQLANEIFEANPVNAETRDRIMVLFTDGIPNVKIGEEIIDDATAKSEIYDEIIAKAAVTKNTYGAQVYSISTTTLGTSENDRTFLSYASSDYPDAVSFDQPGNAIENPEYTFHGSTDALKAAFDVIQKESMDSATEWSDDLTMKEVLSDYFVLDENATVKYEVFTQDYLGNGAWSTELVPFDADVTLSASGDGSGRDDVIEVGGFNYHANYIGEEAHTDPFDTESSVNSSFYGRKLVLKVYIETREGFWGGNNVPTNENTTAIYSGTTVIEPFPMPEVNVPIDVEVTVNDETIYYGNDVTGEDLFDSVTINGSQVTVTYNPETGEYTFTPAEDWMNDFIQDVTWAEDSSLPSDALSGTDPEDYTFEIVVTPSSDGTSNSQEENPGNIAGTPNSTDGVSDQDTGHVYILVPTITFKDSTIDFFEQPDYGRDNTVHDENGEAEVTWEFLEDTFQGEDAEAKKQEALELLDGTTEPELSLNYTPVGDTGMTVDTPVDVTVSSSNGVDYDSVTSFDWEDCTDEHNHDEADIEMHPASTGDQPEFYVHVTLAILPETVVIDYGLPVDIDVMANDPAATDAVSRALAGIGLEDATDYATADVVGQFGVLGMNTDSTVRYTLNDDAKLAALKAAGHENVKHGMEMDEEEVFSYGVTYTKSGVSRTESAAVTVIPATTIYYEDSFLTYEIYWYDSAYNDGEGIYDQKFTSDNKAHPEYYGYYDELMWASVGTTENASQGQDRPGSAADALASVDADNIYGYDGAYTSMNAFSLGSAMKVQVGAVPVTDGETGESGVVNMYGTAAFSFRGTGFDVISLTSNKTGTIMVTVKGTGDDGSTYSKNYMVDTYYGYTWGNCDADGDGITGEDEYGWMVSTSDDENALYQIPVMKIFGLPYGSYDVTIKATYGSLFEHGQYGDEETENYYDFYLDAIRIYDPANDGKNNETIENAYVADGEGWPDYVELRDMLISASDFNALEEGQQTSGAIFLDNTAGGSSYTIEDYANYGPNNELYLAAGQAVAFKLMAGTEVTSEVDGETGTTLDTSNIAHIHLAMKCVNGAVGVKVQDGNDADNAANLSMTLGTATDLYYDITGLNNGVVVIENTSTDGAILSITNIKITYKADPNGVDTSSFFEVDQLAASAALNCLNEPEQPEVPETTEPEESTIPTEPEETEPEESTVPTEPEETEPEETTAPTEPEEPETFEPDRFSVRLSERSVKVGGSVIVTVTTSTDVDRLIINGAEVTDYTSSRWSRTRTWKVKLIAQTAGEMEVNVNCVSAEGLVSRTVTETVTVTEKSGGLGDWLIGFIGGLFDKWR